MVNSSRDIKGISLVAFYGANKPPALVTLIRELQQQLQDKLGNCFIPYELEQVHATIIGCEGWKTDLGVAGYWYYQARQETRYLDFEGLLNYFSKTPHLPLTIAFGGYQPEQDYGFLSRNQHPRDRSFAMQPTKEATAIPVMYGWSILKSKQSSNATISLDLDSLRREPQQFNFLHKYHQQISDLDNDLYLRLGTIYQTKFEDLLTIQQQILANLQTTKQQLLELTLDNLAIAKYQELTLPVVNTEIYSLSSLIANQACFESLYN